MKTILFLGGEGIHAEDFLLEEEEHFPGMGVLLSYYGLRGGRQKKRLEKLKGGNDEGESRRAGKDSKGRKNRNHSKRAD